MTEPVPCFFFYSVCTRCKAARCSYSSPTSTPTSSWTSGRQRIEPHCGVFAQLGGIEVTLFFCLWCCCCFQTQWCPQLRACLLKFLLFSWPAASGFILDLMLLKQETPPPYRKKNNNRESCENNTYFYSALIHFCSCLLNTCSSREISLFSTSSCTT